jgi:hypothetical protein
VSSGFGGLRRASDRRATGGGVDAPKKEAVSNTRQAAFGEEELSLVACQKQGLPDKLPLLNEL